MHQGISYRIGRKQDIEAIATLLIQSWKTNYASFIPSKFLDNLSLEKQIVRHTKYMAGDTKYFIAENENKDLVGFTSYGKNRIEKLTSDKELYTLYVKHQYHSKGIGSALLQFVLADLESEEESLSVAVFEKNPFKIFYTKHGFIKTEEELLDLGESKLLTALYIKS